MDKWIPTPAALALLKRIEAREKADKNERKYGEQLTYADRMIEARDDATRNRYDSIEANVGNNGKCTTRRGTWRKLKFGKGNIGKKGFEKLGFKENEV